MARSTVLGSGWGGWVWAAVFAPVDRLGLLCDMCRVKQQKEAVDPAWGRASGPGVLSVSSFSDVASSPSLSPEAPLSHGAPSTLWADVAKTGLACVLSTALVSLFEVLTGLSKLAQSAQLAKLGQPTRMAAPTAAQTALLWLFVFCLLSSVFGALGLLAHVGLRGYLRTSLLGPLLQTGTVHLSRRRGVVLVLVSAALVSAGGYPLCRWMVQVFHHRVLVSLLFFALIQGLALVSLAVALWLISLPAVSRPMSIPEFPEARGRFPCFVAGFAVGLQGFCGLLALGLFRLLDKPAVPGAAAKVALKLSLVSLPLWFFAGVVGYALGRGLAALLRKPALCATPLRQAVCAVVAVCGPVVLGIVFRFREQFAQIDLRVVRSVVLLCGLALVLRWFLEAVQIKRRVVGWLVLLSPGLLWLGATRLSGSETLRKRAFVVLPLAARIVQGAAQVLDWDRDGVAGRFAIGGTDCDDLSADVFPTAFDWPDDGIDQNCNGHDAQVPVPPTLTPPPSGLTLKPNVVLVTIDALRADHVSAYGYARKTTPNLDKLSQEPDGVLFEQAFAHAPSTRYSVPAILTGRYPSQIAWGSPWAHWPPEVLPQNRLLSELLKDAGYHTLALLSYHYFEPTWGLARGFVDYDYHLQTLHSLGGDPAATNGSSSRELTDLAIAKLGPLLLADRPFFLWIHYYDPHFRYAPHPPPAGETSFGDSETDLYDGEIRFTDEQLGRLVDAIRHTKAWDKTLFVVTADHGEGLGEHGIPQDKRHGYHLYANQTKVPLIVRVPGLRGLPFVKRVTTPVGHVDLLPSLLALAGAVLPAQAAGQSLWPLLFAAQPHRRVFQEVMYEGPTVRKAIFDGRYHYVENLIPDGTRELYDLQVDPGENHDLQGLRWTVEQRLAKELAAWMDDSAVPPDFGERAAQHLSKQPFAVAVPRLGRIGQYLRFLGTEPVRGTVRKGASFSVAAVFAVEGPLPAGYKPFFHLLGVNGELVNVDHGFWDGHLPLQRLKPGTYLRDVTKVVVPPGFPSGPATLVMGIYRRSERVAVRGETETALVGPRALVLARVVIE